jgi:hypothetical protein
MGLCATKQNGSEEILQAVSLIILAEATGIDRAVASPGKVFLDHRRTGTAADGMLSTR